MHDKDHALADYGRAIEIQPNNAMDYNNRGSLYEHAGEHDRAIIDLDRAIALDPKLAMAYANRGASHLGKGDADRALFEFDRAIELQPRYAKAFALRGKAGGRRASPLARSQRAYAHNVKAHILASLGRRNEAIAEFKKALAIEPDLQESVQGLKALQRGKP